MPLKDPQKQKEYRQGYWKKYYSDPERKARHISSVRKTDKKRKEIIRSWIDEYRVTVGCKVCGFNEDAVALDFHHREDETKEFNISTAIRSGWSLERIKEEVAKCDVLCANHHRIHHFHKARWPSVQGAPLQRERSWVKIPPVPPS